MTTAANMELPIKPAQFQGPAINELDRRKEHNDHKKVTADELRASFDTVKTSLFDGLRTLLR